MGIASRAWLMFVVLAAAGCATRPVAPPRHDLVSLVAKPDGSLGSVVVYQGRERLVLDSRTTGARIRSASAMEAATVPPEELRATFGAAVGALPPRPQSFTLYFVEGKDELTAESKAAIAAVQEQILLRPAPEITVTGHTDDIGSDRFNDQLSLQRARRVTAELVRGGVRPAVITTEAHGSREPLFVTRSGQPEPRNRRVEITAR